MRWDLVDRFDCIVKSDYARSRKAFSGQEDFLQPIHGQPSWIWEPLYIEMIAQTGGVLFGLSLDFSKEVILAKVFEANFSKQVFPPCTLTIEARLAQERPEGAVIEGEVFCDNQPVASCSLFLVTLDKLPLESGDKQISKSIVFGDSFLKHYDVYNVAAKSMKVIS